MELGSILNARLTVNAGTGVHFGMQHAMQHELQQQHFGAPPYINGRIKSENGSDRGVSPHPSDSSRYSSTQPQQLPSYPPMPAHNMNGMRYPSPTQMQTPMPLLNNNNYIPNPPDHPYAQQQTPDQQNQQPGGRPASDTGPPKAFACSTCGKGFARRSDLARHGKELGPQHQKVAPLTALQSVSTVASALTCATTPTVANSSSSDLPSLSINVSTRVRSRTCASAAERYVSGVACLSIHCQT